MSTMQTAQKGPIASLFMKDHAAREGSLRIIRDCARLTSPPLLPPDSQDPDSKLPENFQSLGARGLAALAGQMILGLFPFDLPWLRLALSSTIKFDPNVPGETIRQIEAHLQPYELLVQAKLESANLSYENGIPAGFRSQKRNAIEHILGTGETLERMNDDYTLTVFRRDKYVNRRDSTTALLYHVVEEEIDVKSLTPRRFAKTKIDRSLLEKPSHERLFPVHTYVEWQPRSRMWVITQEINGQTVVTSEEPTNPFICTPFRVSPGENYGRGFVEQNLGDLSSLDKLWERTLDFAAMASRMIPAIDYGSEVKPADLKKRNGEPIMANVKQGMVTDVAFLKVDKPADYQVVEKVMGRLEDRVGASMLLQGARDSERTTALEIHELVVKQNESTLGGFYAPVADKQHVQTGARTLYQLQKDKILPALPRKHIEIKALTGIAALSGEATAGRIDRYIAGLAQYPEGLQRINTGVLAQILARYRNIYEPGLVLTDEEIAQKTRDAIAAQTAAAAGEKAVDVIGNVAQERAAPQAA